MGKSLLLLHYMARTGGFYVFYYQKNASFCLFLEVRIRVPHPTPLRISLGVG